MKILNLLILFLVCLGINAQSFEKTHVEQEQMTGYIRTSTSEDNKNLIKTIDGVLYFCEYTTGEPNVLVKYPPAKKDSVFTIPKTVVRICNYAFEGCKFLKKIRLYNVSYYTSSDDFETRNTNLHIGSSTFVGIESVEEFEVIDDDNN